ncbi:hypothetical protein [Streptomyces prasinus]|uniref:hypothetical protein n=1 Tax=Streptomyces prasinus TaxID=67345 RepID=UPI003137AC29
MEALTPSKIFAIPSAIWWPTSSGQPSRWLSVWNARGQEYCDSRSALPAALKALMVCSATSSTWSRSACWSTAPRAVVFAAR